GLERAVLQLQGHQPEEERPVHLRSRRRDAVRAGVLRSAARAVLAVPALRRVGLRAVVLALASRRATPVEGHRIGRRRRRRILTKLTGALRAPYNHGFFRPRLPSMKARKPMVAGNWKMNGDIVSNEHLFTALRAELGRASLAQVEVVVCPPYPYLGQAAAWLGDTGIAWGAQDVSALPNGAYTGDVSASMLVDLGCRWSIVGHSERRQLAGESDEQVAAKVSMCIAQDVGVIACVGETLDEREAGATDAVLGRQVDAIAKALTATGETLSADRIVLAYEPVWAIGTGRTADRKSVV